jgi:hypothetical protein
MSVKDVNKIPKFKKKLKQLRKKRVRVGVFGEHLAKIAASNEFGATIKPKSGKFLAIPLTKDAIGKSPRDFKLNLVFPFLKDKSGKNIFILKKKVIIPERSFIRSAFDDKKNDRKWRKIARDIYSFDTPLEKVLDRIGFFMVTAIQKKIKSNIPPKNSGLTTDLKGGKNKTLINTGRLVQGITHKVV